MAGIKIPHLDLRSDPFGDHWPSRQNKISPILRLSELSLHQVRPDWFRGSDPY